MSSYTVYIDGAAGTTGLQIEQRLCAQPDIMVLRLDDAVRKSMPHRLAAIADADVSMLCLPDDAAREVVAAAPPTARICDASTAHRTAPGWVYGFAELAHRRNALKTANRVAVPGCHASGFLALATPLVEQGALPKDARLYCHSLTGYSGGGKQMIAAYEAKDRPAGYAASRPYALGMAHKHLPEMQAISGLQQPPLFCPVLGDYYNGMVVSIPLPASQLQARYRSRQAVYQLYADYYSGAPLISVCAEAPEDGTLPANALAGHDTMQLYVLGNDTDLLLCARFDNLGKGAAGAAVQCLNLMLGRPELAGLNL